MKFNTIDYEREFAQLREKLATDMSNWRMSIDHRWGLFMVEQGTVQAQSIWRLQHSPAAQTSRGKNLVNEEYAKLHRHMLQAHLFLTNKVKVKDPVEAEVTLRMYYDRARPKSAA